MPQFYPLSGCKKQAELMQANLALGDVRLFQSSLSPDPTTPLADYTSAECDFDGYTADGISVTAWNAPGLDPLGGYSIGSPVVQWLSATPQTAPNLVGGFYVVDADGDMIAVGVFDSPLPMQVPDQILPIDLRLVFPTGV